jgi:hypothetical protein
MNNAFSQFLVFLCTTFFGVASNSADTHWKCPEKVMPTKIEINTEGLNPWQTTSGEMPLWLSNVGVYDGPVIQNAALVPDQQKNQENLWLFTDTNGNGKFIACEYGNGLIKLSQAVSSATKRCSVKAAKAKNYQGISAEFICSER